MESEVIQGDSNRITMKKPTRKRKGSSSTTSLVKIFVIFTLTLLQFVNQLHAVCPNGCKCDDENLHVICVEANIDIVPITLNPSVQKLILRSNRIKTVDTGPFTFYHELVHIDLSHNHLVKIQANSFSSQTKLVQLNLSNNKISSLSNRTFGGFGSGNQEGLRSLVILNLHDNLLEELEPGVFSYTKNLEELDMSQNKIKDLNTSVINGLEKLRVLRLNSNELTQVPAIFSKNSGSPHFGGFGGMPHLAELFIGTNPIDRLESDVFSGLKSLSTLDLRECHLNSIDANAFRGLSVLRKLILIDNNLRTVPTQSFLPLVQLEILKIGRNPISRIDNLAFAPLRKVKDIEISGAPELAFVAENAFTSNLDLESIEISSGKKLSILPPKLFKGISSLRKLILKENSLGSLPEELASWQSLRSLRLEGNPFHCSCDLLWLRDLLQLDRFRNSSFLVLCSEPKELVERKVSSLSDKEMNCYFNDFSQKTILGLCIGVAILILAIFFFLMYRYHDNIKNTCKRKCFRRGGRSARKNRCATSSTVKASELDNTNTKTSFLSHSSAYPYSDDEFAVRTSLMSSPIPVINSGPPPGSYATHHPTHSYPHMMHPQQHRNSLSGYNGNGGGYNNIHSLGHHHHPHNYPTHSTASPYPNEYESVPINSLGLYPTTHHPQHRNYPGGGGGPLTSLSRNGQDFNNHHNTLQQPMHYNSHQQVVKPIPITEL